MRIGSHDIGAKHPVFVIAEVGINHNGDVGLAKQLIAAAKKAGCNAVKFQKRTVEVVYTPAELAVFRENPFGSTNGDLKRGLEFSSEAYREIDEFCKAQDILWFASPWDEASVDFLERFHVPCYKIASPSLTDAGLLRRVKATDKPVLLSTGMSELSEIDRAVDILGRDQLILLHCVSQYPSAPENIHLRVIQTLESRYGVPVGYSGHEQDTVISAMAVALGACVIERHLTLDRTLWGSDHKASIEPDEMAALVSNIRLIERALGKSIPCCLQIEVPARDKLRRVNSL